MYDKSSGKNKDLCWKNYKYQSAVSREKKQNVIIVHILILERTIFMQFHDTNTDYCFTKIGDLIPLAGRELGRLVNRAKSSSTKEGQKPRGELTGGTSTPFRKAGWKQFLPGAEPGDCRDPRCERCLTFPAVRALFSQTFNVKREKPRVLGCPFYLRRLVSEPHWGPRCALHLLTHFVYLENTIPWTTPVTSHSDPPRSISFLTEEEIGSGMGSKMFRVM